VDWLKTETKQIPLPLLDYAAVLTEPTLFEGNIHLMPTTHPFFAQILGESLSDLHSSFGMRGLPFQMPPNFKHEGNRQCIFTPNGVPNVD
jgi:hypothetical protein